jgi:CheY-like chemotaxis protein
MNETTNPTTGEKITYNRIGGTPDNPIYFNDPTPTSTTPLSQTAIPVSDLQGTQPIRVPNVTPPRSEAPAVIAQADQSVINYQEAQRRADELLKMQGTQAQTERTALNKLAESVFGQRSDVLQSQAQREQALGITEQQKALQTVNDEIASTTIALRAEQDRIRNTPMSQAQKSVELGALEDTYGRRLTDMAIRQSAVQGNIGAIREESDRQTRLLLAPLDNKLQYLSTFAKDNVDALDKKEQQKLNLIINDVQMQREDVKTLQKAKADLITEIANNGGGSNTNLVSQIQGAKTVEEAYALAGKSGFIGKLDRQLKQAQLAKIAQDINGAKPVAFTPVARAQVQQKVSDLTNLSLDKGGLKSAVGTTWLGRIPFLKGGITGERQNFIAGVEQMASQLTLDSLVRAKQNGATFGALSDGERVTLAQSATRIGNWAIRDDTGKVTGYSASETDFRKELDKINNFARLDYIYRGGNPEEVGVVIAPDGNLFAPNSMGTFTALIQ